MHKIFIGLAAASCLALSAGASFAQDRPDQRQVDHRVVEQSQVNRDHMNRDHMNRDHMDRRHHRRHRVCTVRHHHRVCRWR